MCQAAILDEEGALLDEICFPNDPEGIEEFIGKLTTFHDEVRAVVESTGNLWIQIHDRLEEHGFEVALSNPAKTRLIAEAKVKTDKVDAKTTLGDVCRWAKRRCLRRLVDRLYQKFKYRTKPETIYCRLKI